MRGCRERNGRRWAALLAPSVFALSLAVPAGAQSAASPPTEVGDPGAAGGVGAPKVSTESPPADAPKSSSATPPPKSGGARSEAFQAYQRALEARRLSSGAPLSRARLEADLRVIENKLSDGRRDEAIADLVYLVESPRFAPFASTLEGRAAVFLLGDALGRAGAHEPARAYLGRLLEGSPDDVWYRRAVDTLVDLALESDAPEPFLETLARVPKQAPPEIQGDLAYLEGRTAEWRGNKERALAAYARVNEHSRFWAQATYLSGVLEVERKNFKRGEELFCKVADPKRTPKRAALFGRADFFRVRDLARLGLGRVAHEQYRFDDARYYYYLVPNDSERLPEALYETATTRYEAKDYDGAREAMDELKRLGVDHPYQDEAIILDAYIDLAVCRFPDADRKLTEFLEKYEPARDAARRLLSDPRAMRRLVETVRKAEDPALAGLGIPDQTARALGAALRLDAGYARATRRRSQLEHQLSGLRRAMGELDEAARRLSTSGGVKPHAATPLGQEPRDKLARIDSQIAELKRLIRAAEQGGAARREQLAELVRELEALELRARAARLALDRAGAPAGAQGTDLPGLIAADRELATRLHAEAASLHDKIEEQQLAFARAAFERLDRRLTRLLNRARLGRIETVLGKKRALEIEVEALTKGLLPQTIVDSLRAERYLENDEEYWPFEGEDWEDEYVGGEGLR